MKAKTKRRLQNLIMALLILVIAVSGAAAVAKFQGWFDKPEEAVMSSGTVRGVVNIERKGIGYTLKEDTALQAGDTVETKKNAQAQLLLQDTASFTMNGSSEAVISACTAEAAEICLESGELFGDAGEHREELAVVFAEHRAMLADSVFSVSVQAGSSSLSVYDGDVSVFLSDGTQERVEAGEILSLVDGEDGGFSYEIHDIQIESLSEFLIAQAQGCSHGEDLCFTKDQLAQVLDDREAEKQAALEASLNAERITGAEPETGEAESEAGNASSAGETEEQEEQQGAVEEYVSGGDGDSGSASSAKVCTITILCDTILDNMDNLDDGKEAYVPANGTILATSSVEFEEGETVFDVLKRVCDYAGIQLEYSWTAIYDSYYIEGINNLYEFDCGNESGWMYKVNGWFPNYGCSSYDLEDGDNIVWCYTCNGLGADVGGGVY